MVVDVVVEVAVEVVVLEVVVEVEDVVVVVEVVDVKISEHVAFPCPPGIGTMRKELGFPALL